MLKQAGRLDAARTFLDDDEGPWTTGRRPGKNNDAANHFRRGAGVELGRDHMRCGAGKSCRDGTE